MPSPSILGIILAGGKGTRMHSGCPKVLMPIANVPMLECAAYNFIKSGISDIVVVGSTKLQQHISFACVWERIQQKAKSLHWAQQEQALGTGHALQCGIDYIQNNLGNNLGSIKKVIVCNADTPLISPTSFQQLINSSNDLSLLAMRISNPEQSTYGRILCQQNRPISIIETKEATPEQKQIDLVNVGGYAFSLAVLQDLLPCLTNVNQSQEFYITDLVKLAYQKQYSTAYFEIPDDEGYGIDTVTALQSAPVQFVLIQRALEKGAVIPDPDHVLLSFDTEIGPNSTIFGFNAFGPNVVIENSVTILPFCYLENCHIQSHCTIGPFAHVKESSTIFEKAVIGNFVEIKKSKIGPNTKIKHLSYVGDATLGQHVNVGAGAVFCNYDGWKKHPTCIEDHVKIGANVSLVAPLTVHQNAFIGAGSVITKDVPEQALALSRSPQIHRENWTSKRFPSIKKPDDLSSK